MMDTHLTTVLFLLLLLGMGLPMAGAMGAAPRAHPFLICTADQFETLRQRAADEPWATMQRQALDAAAAAF